MPKIEVIKTNTNLKNKVYSKKYKDGREECNWEELHLEVSKCKYIDQNNVLVVKTMEQRNLREKLNKK